MANLLRNLRPPYPVYDRTPIFGGQLPSIDEIGPPDMRPSGMNPYYDMYRGARGRNVAGLGQEEPPMNMSMSTDTSDVGLKNYPNELDLLAAADDIQGNGVFDPHGTPGNISPDAGVFADHQSLPGYLVRDRYYEPSQVIDATTGEPVMYVPGGAVAIDQGQVDTFRARQLMYKIPPGVSPQSPTFPSDSDSWIPNEASWPVSGLGQEVGMANPASANCIAKGGTVSVRDVAGGQAGYCTLPDGTTCEEWALYRGECGTKKSRAGLIAGFAIGGAAIGIFLATLMKK
jgi:hypothetical protein